MDDVRPPNKVTDYSSSSEESDTTDDDDDEEVDQEAGEESTSGPEDSRAVYVWVLSHTSGPSEPAEQDASVLKPPLFSCRSSRLSNGETESVKTMIVHDEGESDAGSTPCKDSTLIVRQVPSQQEVHARVSFPIFLRFLSSVPSSCAPSVSIPSCLWPWRAAQHQLDST